MEAACNEIKSILLEKVEFTAKSAGMLLSLIHGEKLPSDAPVIPTHLIIRGSTKKLG